MRRKLVATSSAAIFLLSSFLFAPAASADGGCPSGMHPNPDAPTECIVSIVVPGGDSSGNNGNGGGGGEGNNSGGQPGTPECVATGEGFLRSEATIRQPGPVPCADANGNPWNATYQCYVRTLESDPGKPDGEIWLGGTKLTPENDEGSYYLCDQGSYGSAFQSPIWSDTPLTGPVVPPITPAEAAAELFKRFQFQGVDIGIVPHPGEGSQGSVGLPIWMWVNNPAENTYGPWTQSDTIRGLFISGTAKVTSIDWDMGDGTIINCANTGSVYDVSYGVIPSPNCGYSYSRMSKNLPGGKYTVTATSHWQFDWEAGGQTGSDTTVAQSVTQIDIGEMQTVIVK